MRIIARGPNARSSWPLCALVEIHTKDFELSLIRYSPYAVQEASETPVGVAQAEIYERFGVVKCMIR